MSVVVKKECHSCGLSFDGFYASKYCSEECNPRTPKNDISRFCCINCNKIVESRKRKNFCSSFCKDVYVENFYGGEYEVSFVRFVNDNRQ